jgi:hypothetical protein
MVVIREPFREKMRRILRLKSVVLQAFSLQPLHTVPSSHNFTVLYIYSILDNYGIRVSLVHTVLYEFQWKMLMNTVQNWRTA